jgi:NADPH2:quinone reductase
VATAPLATYFPRAPFLRLPNVSLSRQEDMTDMDAAQSRAVLSHPTYGFVLDAFGGPEVLRLVEWATRAPSAGEVLVDVEVAGVNFADTMIRRGEYLHNQPLSMAPGCEVVGRVALAGASSGRAPGVRVAAWVESGGAYANRVIVPAHRTYEVPHDLPAAAIAALFLQGTTSDYAVHRFGKLKAGETLLVHGAAGGVGGLAVQLGAIAGARVIATASCPAKRELAREQGAEIVLDSGDPDVLTEHLLDITDGHGCDVIVDGVGGTLFLPSLMALASRGRYVVTGSASQQPATFDARHLLPRNQTVVGFILHHVAAGDSLEPARTLMHLCDLAREGELRPRYEIAPLVDAPDVHRRIEDRSLTGKVVLKP